MANPYKVKFYHDENDCQFEYGHTIIDDMNDPDARIKFLWERPENLGSECHLFNGWDYLEAIKFGMKLANLGYDDIEVEHL